MTTISSPIFNSITALRAWMDMRYPDAWPKLESINDTDNGTLYKYVDGSEIQAEGGTFMWQMTDVQED